MLELIRPAEPAALSRQEPRVAAIQAITMHRRLFGDRRRTQSASSDTSQETQDGFDFNPPVSIDSPTLQQQQQQSQQQSQQQQRPRMPLPLLRRDVSDNTNNPQQISDTTDAYDSDSDDENDPYFGSANAREDAAQLRRQAVIQAMAPTFRCMSLECMPDPDEMGVPTLMRQAAFSAIETIQLRCVCCGQLDEIEIYY